MKVLVWLLAGFWLGAVFSCGPAPQNTAALAVALLLAGPENDEGWNQSAYEGLAAIRDQLGAQTRKITARSATEIQRALSQAAEEGFDLIIGHGFEFNAPAARVAARYPEVCFVTTGGTETASNLASLVFRVEEPAFQLGVLAGHLTRSKVVSAISGEPYEPVKRVVAGFRAGLQSIHADAKVLEEYLGSWEDAALAKEKAIAHAAADADLFFQNVDAAAIGIFEACRSRGLLAFGCNRDQSAKAPDVVLASAIADIPTTLKDLAVEVQEGRFQGGLRSFGLKESKTGVVYNPALWNQLLPAATEAVESAATDLLEGKVHLSEL
jgi:basic membrane lipoprotein Med (substrate-binding protein (PBP1-ABC) superfamily)